MEYGVISSERTSALRRPPPKRSRATQVQTITAPWEAQQWLLPYMSSHTAAPTQPTSVHQLTASIQKQQHHQPTPPGRHPCVTPQNLTSITTAPSRPPSVPTLHLPLARPPSPRLRPRLRPPPSPTARPIPEHRLRRRQPGLRQLPVTHPLQQRRRPTRAAGPCHARLRDFEPERVAAAACGRVLVG